MQSYHQPKKEVTLDVITNLKSTVSNLKKSLNSLKITNETLTESTSSLTKLAEQIHFKQTHEITTARDTQNLHKRLEQFLGPTADNLNNHTDAKLTSLAKEKQLLQKLIQSQHDRINSYSQPKKNRPAETMTTMKEQEQQLIHYNKELKQALVTITGETTELTNELNHLSTQLESARAKANSYRPDLSRIKTARLELEEEKGKLIELEKEKKLKLEQRRNVVDSEEKEPEDQIQSSVQSLSSDDKDEFIQHVLSQITNPEFTAIRSVISKSIIETKRYKDTFPKKNHSLNIDTSDPKAVEAWLEKKSNSLSKGLIPDPRIAKIAGGVIELLVSKSRVSIAQLQTEFPLSTDEDQRILFKTLHLLNKAGAIRLEGEDIVFKM